MPDATRLFTEGERAGFSGWGERMGGPGGGCVRMAENKFTAGTEEVFDPEDVTIPRKLLPRRYWGGRIGRRRAVAEYFCGGVDGVFAGVLLSAGERGSMGRRWWCCDRLLWPMARIGVSSAVVVFVAGLIAICDAIDCRRYMTDNERLC